MSTTDVEWSCSECKESLENKQSRHSACQAPTRWHCVWSQTSGLYKNYKRHAESCIHCSPELLRQIVRKERADKENRLTSTAETESSQFAATPDQRSGVDMGDTDAFVLFLSYRSLPQRSCKNRGQAGRWTRRRCTATRA